MISAQVDCDNDSGGGQLGDDLQDFLKERRRARWRQRIARLFQLFTRRPHFPKSPKSSNPNEVPRWTDTRGGRVYEYRNGRWQMVDDD